MQSVTDILMPITISLIMCGIGLSLKFKNFKRVFIQPKPVITGLVCQLLLLPLVAFALIYYWPIDPVYKVGMIIIASAPGGTASNLVTHMLKGQVALSVSLTSFNSFAILLTIPLFVGIALNVFMGDASDISISASKVSKDITLTVILPVLIGIGINEITSEKFTETLKQPLRYIMPTLLLCVFSLALFTGEKDQTIELTANLDLYIPLILFNGITMIIGFYIARVLDIDHASNYTIAVEMGLQNSALAIFIASQTLQNQQMELVAIIYGSFSFFSTWFFAWLMKHYLKPKRD